MLYVLLRVTTHIMIRDNKDKVKKWYKKFLFV